MTNPANPPIVLLVCGGRDYADYAALAASLDQLRAEIPLRKVLHGAARGADSLAGRWAQERGIPVQEYPAQWRVNGRYNNRAGLERNQRMLQQGQPDMVAAFPGGTGTAHMVSISRRAGVPVRQLPATAAKTPAANAPTAAKAAVKGNRNGNATPAPAQTAGPTTTPANQPPATPQEKAPAAAADNPGQPAAPARPDYSLAMPRPDTGRSRRRPY